MAVAGAALVIFLRSIDTFLHPISGWEDATQGLNVATSPGAGLLHWYAGYVSVLPNLVNWAAVRMLPLQAVPFAQAYFGLAAAACVAAGVAGFLRHAAGWRPARAAAGGFCVACLPWGDVAAVSNTEFSIWPLLAVLLLTALNPVPNTMLGKAGFVAWRAGVIASIPVSVICLPIWLVLAWRGRRDAGRLPVYVCLAAATLAYLAFGVEHGGAHGMGVAGVLGGVGAALRLATEKSLLALSVRDVLRVNYGALNTVFAGLALAATAWGLWRCLPVRVQGGRSMRLVALWLLALMLAVCMACGLGRGVANGEAFVLASPRYHYVPQILWLVIFAVVLGTVAGRWRAPVMCVAVIAAALMWQKGWKSYQSDNREESRRISVFLRDADAQHGQASEPRYARVRPDGDWSIILFKPGARS
jgi:hypothetical protein